MPTYTGAVQANQNYALLSAYGIYDREVRKQLGLLYPSAGALSWMKAAGRLNQRNAIPKRSTRRHEYSYWEEGNWFNANAVIESVAEFPASSGQLNITLKDVSHYDSGTKSFPVVGQTVLFSDENYGFIDSINRATPDAHVVHVIPAAGCNIITPSYGDGDEIAFVSNAQKERSTATEPRIPQQIKNTFYMQTFREYAEVSDHEMQNATEFEFKKQPYLYVKSTDDTAQRFEFQEDLGLLVGKKDNDDLPNGEKMVDGLIPQIKAHGIDLEYTTADMTDFDTVIKTLQKNYGDMEYIVGRGINLSLTLKNWLVTFQDATPDVFFEQIGKEQSMNFNFRSVAIEGWTFHMHEIQAFNHPNSLGLDTFPYKDMAVFMPAGKTRDPRTQTEEPYIQCVYSNPGGAAHENFGHFKLWETGANANRGATSDEMVRAWHWYSVKSLEIRNRNKFLVWSKDNS
jgi:hypothetical protein